VGARVSGYPPARSTTLRHHLQALEEILSRIRSPRPTKALKKLMASGGD
jgi:hypothetical protein